MQNEIAATPQTSNPESETASVEMSKILEQAIESLPEQYRTVVMMRDVEEMTTAETAECLSLTEENVKVRLHRAHEELRRWPAQSSLSKMQQQTKGIPIGSDGVRACPSLSDKTLREE